MTTRAAGTGEAGPAVGRRNALTDVPGLRVGHHGRRDNGYLTGTTVVLAPDGGMVAGVDVRGGGPGTRETDLLHPTATVERIHAVTLTGGSAYGLAAASGVAEALGDRQIGLPVGPEPHQVVPLVPGAVIFDLGRGGDFHARPTADFGRAAVDAALFDDAGDAEALGSIGAGTGAVAGGLKGGIGQASCVLPDGVTVAALVVVNAMGGLVDPDTGLPWAMALLRPEDGAPLPAPSPQQLAALVEAAAAGRSQGVRPRAGHTIRNTTIGVLATDASLSKAQCTKLASIGHDGFARAIHPVHTLFDGDTLFGLSTARRPVPDMLGYQSILIAAADVVARAVVRALLAARGVRTAGGTWSSYGEIVPALVR